MDKKDSDHRTSLRAKPLYANAPVTNKNLGSADADVYYTFNRKFSLHWRFPRSLFVLNTQILLPNHLHRFLRAPPSEPIHMIAKKDSGQGIEVRLLRWLRSRFSPAAPSEPLIQNPGAASQVGVVGGYQAAYDPALLPPPELMGIEGIRVLEEWFRWAEEWSMMLRVYGGIAADSTVLEIGCGLGRIAFPLRFILDKRGTYDGFEICRNKVEFLQQHFQPAFPNFHFTWADVCNTEYNPQGTQSAADYRFPYEDTRFDLIFAASVFTHMTPENVRHYFAESARVLRPGGRCLFSFFLLNYYVPGRPRPYGFSHDMFNFDHPLENWGDDFALVDPSNPELMTAYRLQLLERFASDSGLRLAQPPVSGMWSGAFKKWIGAQDLLVLTKD